MPEKHFKMTQEQNDCNNKDIAMIKGITKLLKWKT